MNAPAPAAIRVGRGLMEACAAVLAGLLVFDWILAVAILNPVIPASGSTPMPEEIHIEVAEEPVRQVNTDEISTLLRTTLETEPAVCQSHFTAVLEPEPGLVCLENPTNQMAHWGPPTNAWLRHNGGLISATGGDLVSDQSHCSCLATQEPYHSHHVNRTLHPVTELRLDGELLAIQKWVCADRCLNED